MSTMIINSYAFVASDVSTLLEMGYFGNMLTQASGNKDLQEAFDGTTSETSANSASTISAGTADGELGYDFSWEKPNGIKLDKVVVYASNNNGYIIGADPTDVVLYLEAWDGSWNAVGNTGAFTDANSLTKTVTSSDQTTLFTRIRVLVETATSARRTIAELEIHEVTAGQLTLNVIETDMSRETNGPIMTAFDGVTDVAKNDSASQIFSTTADSNLGVAFHTPYKIEKVILYATNDEGFFSFSEPTDVQLDLEGWNGSSWIALGDTGTFTDADSLVKTITSSDQTTLFEKVRVLISTASSNRRLLAEAEFFVLRAA